MRFQCRDQRAQLKAVFGKVGDPAPDCPVPKILSEIDAGVSGTLKGGHRAA